MATKLIKDIEAEYLKDTLPDIHPGDTVKVGVRIQEGKKERIQGYEGVIIAIDGAGLNRTVTVRRVFQGVGVERVFLLHSPKVESIKVLRRGDVRRAKLYYMRGRSGKAARIREKVGTLLPTEPKVKNPPPNTPVKPSLETSIIEEVSLAVDEATPQE